MKRVLTVLAMGLFSINLYASQINGEDMDIQSLAELDEVASQLAAVSDVKLVTIAGPAYASVQPTTQIKFSYRSCSKLPFKVKYTELDRLTFIALDLDRPVVDCAGPTSLKKYSLQIASDSLNKRVVVLNPVSSDLNQAIGPIDPNPRICTAVAGILVHEKTARCERFTNGCQQAKMLNNGFRQPLEDECHHGV